jgi:hypothetical protein
MKVNDRNDKPKFLPGNGSNRSSVAAEKRLPFTTSRLRAEL